MNRERAELTCGFDAEGQPMVMVEETVHHDLEGIVAARPDLVVEAGAAELAEVINHLAHGVRFALVLDPESFERHYREQLDRENPADEWQEGVMRLTDYGVPDFSSVKAPRGQGGQLAFVVTERATGLPYQVTVTVAGAAPEYEPLALTPIPKPPAPSSAGPAASVAAADVASGGLLRPKLDGQDAVGFVDDE